MTRSRTAKVLAGAVALAGLSLLPAGTAQAEPTFVPQAGDIVGVGSDTSMFALNNLADGVTVDGVSLPGYNAGRSSGRLVSFDAFGEGLSATIVPKQGAPAITRPNGSGNGKATLYGGEGGNGVTAIDFARSSSALNATEVSANLWAVPFSVDGMRLAVRAAGTNAPNVITPSQMVAMYKGEITNWNQVGGGNGSIVPLMPQSGSGTYAFFIAQLKAANGGVDVVPGPNVQETQEHDVSLIKDNPNAFAPFSTGRAKTQPSIRLLSGSSAGGFEANRALYNVVRQADLTAPWFEPIFGSTGFICSTEARALVDASGFEQLARPEAGGVCGVPTQAATSNFTTNEEVLAQDTTTALVASVKGQKVTLRATVSAGSGTPVGEVEFLDGGTPVGTSNLAGGVAILSLSNVPAGKHTYTARYTSGSEAFRDSESASRQVQVTALKASTITVKVPAKARVGTKPKATVTVTAGKAPAKGKVTVVRKGTTVAQGKLAQGKVVLTLKRLAQGRNALTFSYLGNAITKASAVKKTVTMVKK